MYSLFTLSAEPTFAEKCFDAGICPECGDEHEACRCLSDDFADDIDVLADYDAAYRLAAGWADSVIALATNRPEEAGWARHCAEMLRTEGWESLALRVLAAI